MSSEMKPTEASMEPPTMPPQTLPVPTPFQNASLYVGDLHHDVTEAYLFDLFNAVGPVQSIRVCRDAVTRRSLGYAYVNFINSSDAERALDTMNYTMIRNRPCRMMWSQRDPKLRKLGTGNVFVKHLDLSIDNKALYDTFSLFGNILSCKVVTDSKGKSKGFGFVHFETIEAAEEAIKKINGMLLAGKEVFVGMFLKKNERPASKEWTNVYVKNLPLDWTQTKFEEEFSKFGEINSCVVMLDDDNKSKGFGFVDFKDHESAVKACETHKEEESENSGDENGEGEKQKEKTQKIVACKAQKKSEREREMAQKFEQLKMERAQQYEGVNLYVKNLDDNVDDEMLKKEFSPYGEITSARVMMDKSGVSRGFGFVCFTSSDEAVKAVQEMNGKLLISKPIYVALAQRKDQRRVQLEAQLRQQQRMMNMNIGQQQMMGMNMNFGNMNLNGATMRQQQQQQMHMMGMMNMRAGQQMPRNMMQQRMPPMQQQFNNGVRSMPMGRREPALSVEMLANVSQNERKAMIGDKLFPMVQMINPKLASKITGMLLEMDNNELLHMLETPEALTQKVGEAMQELEAAGIN